MGKDSDGDGDGYSDGGFVLTMSLLWGSIVERAAFILRRFALRT